MSTRLILVRHGETDWSYEKRYCGVTDIPLNEKGKEQARQVSKRLEKEKIHKVYSSDMKRPFQFAEIVFKDRHVEKLDAFREMNFGVLEGLTYQEIMKKYAELYKSWLDDPVANVIRGGEGLGDLAERVRTALQRVLSYNKNKTAAIFTHAGPIRVVLCDALGLDLKEIWKVPVNLGGISIMEFINGRGRVLVQDG